MRTKQSELSHEKTSLAARLLESEEERLRLSKTAIDVQIEATQAQEDAEKRNYDLTSKVLELQSLLLERTVQREAMAAKMAASDKAKLKVDP